MDECAKRWRSLGMEQGRAWQMQIDGEHIFQK